MRNRLRIRARSRGLTLVEVMIALLLGLIVIAAAFLILKLSRDLFRESDEIASLQENARVALETLSRDIRQAGRLPVSRLEDLVKEGAFTTVVAPGRYTRAHPVHGLEGESTANGKLDGDTLTLGFAERCIVRLAKSMNRADAELSVLDPEACQAKSGEVWVIEDLEAATIFRLTTIQSDGRWAHETPKNEDAELYKAYAAGGWLARYQLITYSLGVSSESDRPELTVRDHQTGDFYAVAEGVERLRFRYGVDEMANGVPSVYKVAREVTDWGRVRSVEISLLMRGNLPLRSQPPSYVFPRASDGEDEVVTHKDRFVRRVFRRVVKLNN